MAYKILTKNGIDNSNIDGARGEYFNSGMRDGIVQGALNEGAFIASSSNVISLDTCELRIAGHRIVIDEPVYHTFTNAPSTDTRYAFVAQIIVDDNQNVEFSLFVQAASTPLIQNDLYKTITGAGTYQIEIGRFTLSTLLTIEDVVKTIDVITGGTGKGSGASINIGNVTTNTLDPDVDAEVDVSERYEEDEGKEYLDFTFGIPKAEVNVDTELSTTSENAVQNKAVTNALNGKLGNSGEQTITDGGLTVSKTMTIVDAGSNTSRTTTNLAQLNKDGLSIGELKETTTSSGSNTVTKGIQYGLSGIELNYSKIVDIDDNGVFNFSNKPTVSNESGESEELVSESQLAQLPKEYAVQVNTGSTVEYIHIGSFPVYDTNITVDISCTATSILTGRVVLSCTNHVINTAYVYADPYRELSSKLFYSLQNNTIDLYFQAPEYQKLMYKVWYDTAGDAEPTVDGTRLSTLPSTATNTIPNALDRTSQLRIGGTVATLGVVSNLNTISQPVNSTVTYSFGGGCANAPITDSGMVIQMQESYSYSTQLVIANDENASTWRRSYRNGTWTDWEKLTKLKSKTFTSTVDFCNFMQDNIDFVSEVIITPSADITGTQTNLNITSSESTFTSSSPTVLYADFEYRFNQFTKTSTNIQLEGRGFTSIVGENHLTAVATSGGMLRFGQNTAILTASNYTISQAYAQGQYTNLTFEVYYFD